MKIKYIAALVSGHCLSAWLSMTAFAQAEETNAVSDTLKDGLRRGTDGSAMEQPVTTPDPFFLFLQVMGYLALIIGLLYILMRWVNRKRWTAETGKRIHILGGTSFGPSKSVQLVKVGGSVYVLGVGDNVQLIDKVDDPLAVHQLIEEMRPAETADPFQFFRSLFSQWKADAKKQAQQKNGEKTVRTYETDDSSRSSFQQVVMERMQQMPRRKRIIEEWLEEEANSDDRVDRR